MDALLPRLAGRAAVVQVADRVGPPSAEADRLPAGRGSLPLEPLLAGLVRHGYAGDFEFDPVGELVEAVGHAAIVRETAATAGAWLGHRVGSREAAGVLSPPRSLQRRAAAAGVGSRRSHASSQTVSRG
jgi:hypothetical protein